MSGPVGGANGQPALDGGLGIEALQALGTGEVAPAAAQEQQTEEVKDFLLQRPRSSNFQASLLSATLQTSTASAAAEPLGSIDAPVSSFVSSASMPKVAPESARGKYSLDSLPGAVQYMSEKGEAATKAYFSQHATDPGRVDQVRQLAAWAAEPNAPPEVIQTYKWAVQGLRAGFKEAYATGYDRAYGSTRGKKIIQNVSRLTGPGAAAVKAELAVQLQTDIATYEADPRYKTDIDVRRKMDNLPQAWVNTYAKHMTTLMTGPESEKIISHLESSPQRSGAVRGVFATLLKHGWNGEKVAGKLLGRVAASAAQEAKAAYDSGDAKRIDAAKARANYVGRTMAHAELGARDAWQAKHSSDSDAVGNGASILNFALDAIDMLTPGISTDKVTGPIRDAIKHQVGVENGSVEGKKEKPGGALRKQMLDAVGAAFQAAIDPAFVKGSKVATEIEALRKGLETGRDQVLKNAGEVNAIN